MSTHDPGSTRNLIKFSLRMAGDICLTIALPVIALAIIGHWADATLGTKPLGMAASILVSFVVSTVAVCDKAIRYGEQYELLTTDQPPPQPLIAAATLTDERHTGDPPYPANFDS